MYPIIAGVCTIWAAGQWCSGPRGVWARPSNGHFSKISYITAMNQSMKMDQRITNTSVKIVNFTDTSVKMDKQIALAHIVNFTKAQSSKFCTVSTVAYCGPMRTTASLALMAAINIVMLLPNSHLWVPASRCYTPVCTAATKRQLCTVLGETTESNVIDTHLAFIGNTSTIRINTTTHPPDEYAPNTAQVLCETSQNKCFTACADSTTTFCDHATSFNLACATRMNMKYRVDPRIAPWNSCQAFPTTNCSGRIAEHIIHTAVTVRWFKEFPSTAAPGSVISNDPYAALPIAAADALGLNPLLVRIPPRQMTPRSRMSTRQRREELLTLDPSELFISKQDQRWFRDTVVLLDIHTDSSESNIHNATLAGNLPSKYDQLIPRLQSYMKYNGYTEFNVLSWKNLHNVHTSAAHPSHITPTLQLRCMLYLATFTALINIISC